MRRSLPGVVVALFLMAAPAVADWLVTLDGGRVETKGGWQVKGKISPSCYATRSSEADGDRWGRNRAVSFDDSRSETQDEVRSWAPIGQDDLGATSESLPITTLSGGHQPWTARERSIDVAVDGSFTVGSRHDRPRFEVGRVVARPVAPQSKQDPRELPSERNDRDETASP